MSDSVGRKGQIIGSPKANGSDGSNSRAAVEDDRKPAAAPSGVLDRNTPDGDESGLDAPSTEPGVSFSCEENSIKKRKMNVIYSRRKREKKKRLVAELSQKSVDAQRENVRLKIEGKRLEALMTRALQLAAQHEVACLQQSNLGVVSQQPANVNLLPCNTIPPAALSNSNNVATAVWPPGGLLRQPSSNTFMDADLSRQMAQILAERQSVASLHQRRFSGGLPGLPSQIPSSSVPNNLWSPHSNQYLLNSSSSMDELIHRNLRQQRLDVSLLLRQELNRDIATYPNPLSRMDPDPRFNTLRNIALPRALPPEAGYLNSSIQHAASNHATNDVLSSLVLTRLQDLNQQQQTRESKGPPPRQG